MVEGLQYGFGELYRRTKPRGVRNDFLKGVFAKNERGYRRNAIKKPF